MAYYDDICCNAHGMEDVVKYGFCATCIDGLNHYRWMSGFVDSSDLPICVSGYVICGVLLFLPLKTVYDLNWVLKECVNLPNSHIEYQFELP